MEPVFPKYYKSLQEAYNNEHYKNTILKLEKSLESMVSSDIISVKLKYVPPYDRAIIHSLTDSYNIKSQTLNNDVQGNNKNMLLTKTKKTTVPWITLSTIMEDQEKLKLLNKQLDFMNITRTHDNKTTIRIPTKKKHKIKKQKTIVENKSSNPWAILDNN